MLLLLLLLLLDRVGMLLVEARVSIVLMLLNHWQVVEVAFL